MFIVEYGRGGSEGKNVSNQLHTQWYIADTPRPAIFGLPACSKLGIVELNCAVSFHRKKPTQQKPTTEHQQVQKGRCQTLCIIRPM